MQEFELRHEKHAHHMSVVATGITVAGPLGDGFVHLVFHRDGARVVKEVFDAEAVGEAGGPPALRVHGQKAPPEVEFFREEVATVLVPKEQAASFAEVFTKLAEMTSRIRSEAEGTT